MNLYVVLGLPREASSEDIKRAYRRLARKYHPDVNPGDAGAAAMYRRVSDAYETLADPERRRRYDAGEESAPAAIESRFEFAGFDFSARVEGTRASTFGELFSDALGAAMPQRSRPEQGADVHVTVALGFEEAARGSRRAVDVTRLEHCAACDGRGFLVGAEVACTLCDGEGRVRGGRGHMLFSRVCPSCDGAGRVRQRTCPACGGEGVGARNERIAVEIPPGAADGAVLSVPGQGHAGRRGGPPGDLRVTVTVGPHPFFTREGNDLAIDVPVAVHEAGLGAKIEIPTLDGPARLRVPPGAQTGQTFRLRERGFPGRNGRRGDLIARLRIVLPAVLDERSKALLREFGDANPESVRTF